MFLTGFFFLLALTGGKTSILERPDLLDDPRTSNQSMEEMPGGTTEELPEYIVYYHEGYHEGYREGYHEKMSGGTTEEPPGFHDDHSEDVPGVIWIGGGLADKDEETSTLMNYTSDDFISGISTSNTEDEISPLRHRDYNPGDMGDEDTYTFNMENIPEYLKEYYASFNETSAPWKCSYDDILSALHLKEDRFTMSRPVQNHNTLMYIYLEMVVSAILDVRETDQIFVAHIWLYMSWDNKFIRWHPKRFCGIKHVIIPTGLLWKPDVIIEEMVEKDKTPPSPYLKINSYGEVHYRNDQVVSSTCKMDVYRFPYDIQKCNISFKSLMHSDKEIKFAVKYNTTGVTKWSHMVMQTQYEWLFIKMTVTNKTDAFYFGENQTVIVYTIYMKRRSVLYVANFLLPVFFFLCLDLASFLISDSGGEKIGFKVTVLLAVTVMQLILNEILPCSSDRMPLIAVYCVGIFVLMLLSLLETIFVMHLMEKDSASQDNKTDTDHKLNKDKQSRVMFHSCFREMKKYTNCASCDDDDVSADQTPSVTKEEKNSQLKEVSLTLGKVSNELEEIEKSMAVLGGKKEEEKPGYWTRVAKKIHKVFFIVYVTSATLFLVVISSLWTATEEDL